MNKENHNIKILKMIFTECSKFDGVYVLPL